LRPITRTWSIPTRIHILVPGQTQLRVITVIPIRPSLPIAWDPNSGDCCWHTFPLILLGARLRSTAFPHLSFPILGASDSTSQHSGAVSPPYPLHGSLYLSMTNRLTLTFDSSLSIAFEGDCVDAVSSSCSPISVTEVAIPATYLLPISY
jgi:hypothetical protein